MDHAQAVQSGVAERYLLGELSAAEENEFVDHFFDCETCAQDLRVTSLFMETAKGILAKDLVRRERSSSQRAGSRRQPAGYAVAASVALFAVILYQNLVTLPRLRNAAVPQALQYFSLESMGTRGGAPTILDPVAGRPFALLLDITPHPDVSAYRCQVLTPKGKQVVSIDVSEDSARRSVPLLIPPGVLEHGDYWFTVSGRASDASGFRELERYPFQVR